MGTWKFKSCLRCGGDMFIATDMDGWFEQCVQCSYRKELEPVVDSKRKLSQIGKTPGTRGKR